jgi:hypothetical protein
LSWQKKPRHENRLKKPWEFPKTQIHSHKFITNVGKWIPTHDLFFLSFKLLVLLLQFFTLSSTYLVHLNPLLELSHTFFCPRAWSYGMCPRHLGLSHHIILESLFCHTLAY